MKKKKISGVYKITNIITGDFYIGSSKDIKYRWATHKCPSVHKQRPNSKLYKDMSSYGLDNFTIEVIEETTDLHNREQYYIECLKPSYNNYRANGIDIKRKKETTRRYKKERYKVNRNELLTKSKNYLSRLCLYEGETLTLAALSRRFFRQGILHSYMEAKNYLIEKEE